MESILAGDKEKRGLNKIFLIGIVAALLLIGAVVYLLSLRPSMEEQTASLLAGALREDSPEFGGLSKDIVIADDKTVESPTGLGTISMFINGKIYNKGNRTVDILEVKVAVITQFNQVLKE